MKTFGFINNVPAINYPEEAKTVALGGGYTFASDPVMPVYRTIKVMLFGMTWFFNPDGSLNETTESERNAQALAKFYEEHRLHKTFRYDLDGEGLIDVRFKEPMRLPRTEGRMGVLPPFEITLVEDE